MNEYKRWISYLYEYVEGGKKENVGFLRVEIRGPLCRIRIGLAGNRTDRQAEARVFLLAERAEGVREISLGMLPAWNVSREGIFQTRSGNMAGSGLDWRQFSGVKIYCEETRREYRTYWDDRIQRGEAARREEKRKMEEEENIAGSLSEEETLEEREADLPDEEVLGEKPENLVGEEALEENAAVPQEAVECSQAEAAECDTPREEPELEEADESASRWASEYANPSPPADMPDPPIRSQEPRITWAQLQGIFPKSLPFGPADPWEVMRIGLQDIGRLPREHWVLGANEFVIHGYYDHRHLALIRDETGEFCYLGVPGAAQEADRRVAELFGFRAYRPAASGGYWLTRIKL